MNKKIDNNLKNTKRTPANSTDSINKNIKTTDKNINNSFKNANSKPATTRSASRTMPSSSPRTASRVTQRSVSTSPVVDSPMRTSRDKTYIVLVWQSRSAGVIRRIMEVPGTQLTRTLDNIRMQKKAFSFYEKR